MANATVLMPTSRSFDVCTRRSSVFNRRYKDGLDVHDALHVGARAGRRAAPRGTSACRETGDTPNFDVRHHFVLTAELPACRGARSLTGVAHGFLSDWQDQRGGVLAVWGCVHRRQCSVADEHWRGRSTDRHR